MIRRRLFFFVVLGAVALVAGGAPAVGLVPGTPAPPAPVEEARCLPASCGSTDLPGKAGTIYREEWIPTDTPLTTMHADVVRSSQSTWDEQQPVILVASPYGNHAGQNYWNPFAGREENGRFGDFLQLSGALEQGYTYVMVDLPGFGGSSGCSDLGGPLERSAVKRAVEWAAAAPWSTGKVALFGKSYDGWTGLMGLAEKPEGLAAVIAMEPVYTPYIVDFSNGIRNLRSFAMPLLYVNIEAYPGTESDSPEYHANGALRPHCFAVNEAEWMNDDPHAPGWVARDIRPASAGSETPVFLVQGLLETNTVQRGAFDYFNQLRHPGNMAWYGQFDHVRPWETQPWSGGRLESGRPGFVAQAMRFLDLHLKGIATSTADPVISVQDNLGRYRAESVWPPRDAAPFVTELRKGSYLDGPEHRGILTSSTPLTHDVWMAGEAKISVDVLTTAPRANVVATLYDVDERGRTVEVAHDGFLIRSVGHSSAIFPMLGQDWIFRAGHRIVIEIATDNPAFVHIPSGSMVTVERATVELPLLTTGRTTFLEGTRTPRMDETRKFFLSGSPTQVPFSLPDPIDTGPRP